MTSTYYYLKLRHCASGILHIGGQIDNQQRATEWLLVELQQGLNQRLVDQRALLGPDLLRARFGSFPQQYSRIHIERLWQKQVTLPGQSHIVEVHGSARACQLWRHENVVLEGTAVENQTAHRPSPDPVRAQSFRHYTHLRTWNSPTYAPGQFTHLRTWKITCLRTWVSILYVNYQQNKETRHLKGLYLVALDV